MELADDGSNNGKVVGIQGGGSGAPLRRDIWMCLGKEIKTPELGAGEFATAAKDDHFVLGEHSDHSVFFKNLAVVVTKFPNIYQIVMEIGYDAITGDRKTREEHITRCSRDMRGATGGAENNL